MAARYQEARELNESVGDMAGLAAALYNESYVPLLLQGDLDSARRLLAGALDLYRSLGNHLGAAEAEAMIGFSHYFQGEPEAAVPFQESAVEAYRAAGATWQLSENLLGLGQMYAQAGDWARALRSIREALAHAKEMGIEVGVAMTLEVTGAAAAWVGDLERGARLFGKADEMKERLGAFAPSQMVQTTEQRDKAREALGVDRYEQLRSEGARLSSAEAVALAEQFEPPRDAPAMPGARPWGMAADVEAEASATDGRPEISR
jgi:tetratricopeptide (TPR) repeat protein